VPKIAAAVLALVCLTLFSIPMSAQLLPNGNVYAGVSYGQLSDATTKQSYRGWEGSAEVFPFTRIRHLGFVLDATGFYRAGVTQYSGVGGFRLSVNYGNWRPFVHAMAGIRHVNSSGFIYNPTVIDIGGGADYKLWFKNFSWRLQGDWIHVRNQEEHAYPDDYRASTGIVWRF
jgi:hypothetical protein